MHTRWKLLAALGLAVAFSATAKTIYRNLMVDLPQRYSVRLPSPDRRWVMSGSEFSASNGSILTIEEAGSGHTIFSKTISRSIAVAWSPNSRAFFLNDGYASNVESACIYKLGDATPLKLDGPILKADPQARAIPADHTYFRAYRWVTPRTVLAEYCGHTSDAIPTKQFDFLYRITLAPDAAGVETVHRISARVHPPSFRDGAECTK